jgi:hypothetical protein
MCVFVIKICLHTVLEHHRAGWVFKSPNLIILLTVFVRCAFQMATDWQNYSTVLVWSVAVFFICSSCSVWICRTSNRTTVLYDACVCWARMLDTLHALYHAKFRTRVREKSMESLPLSPSLSGELCQLYLTSLCDWRKRAPPPPLQTLHINT